MNENRISPELKISLLYVLIGGLWILFSDALLASLIPNPAFYVTLQTFKGWLFIAVSALALFGLLRRELTRRRAVEKQYIESEALYRQLFENSMDAILLTAPDGSIHAANQAACDLFQRTEAEIQQVGRNGLVNLADPRLKPALEERVRTGRFHGELTFLRHDGTVFEGDVSTNLFKNADGADRTSMIIRDVTERKQADETLRKSEQTLATIFKKAPFAAGLTSLTDGHYLEVNEAFERMFGFSQEEILGKTSLELGMYPDPQMRERSAVMFREHGFVHNLDMRLQTRTGEIHDVLINSDLVEIGGEKYILTTANDITERKRAQEKIRESEKRFSDVFHTSPSGITISQISDGKFIEVNDAFLDMFEFSREDVIGRTSTEVNIISPEARTKLIQMQLETGGLRNIELMSRTKSGKPVCILFSSASIEMEGEACFITSVLDVTARKQAEDELRLAEERFSNAFYTSPAGMTITRIANGKFVDANDSFCRMFEFSREEVIGHTSTELNMWMPEERKKLIDEQIRSGGLQNFELQARSKSGRVVNILFSSKPIELEGETHHITTMIDITERKRVEEELLRSEEKFSILFQKSPLSAALSRIEDGVLVEVNEAFERLFGFTRQEAIGKTSLELGINPDAEKRALILAQIQAQGAAHNVELNLQTKAGVERVFLLNIDRIQIGGQGFILQKAQDITERKRAEAELRIHRDRLADLSRQLVQTHETESRAIGRELHDQIGQMLTALKITLDISRQLPADAAAKKMAQAQELAGELLERVSRLSLELRPPMLDDLGLIPALLWQVSRYQEQTGIPVDFKHRGVEGQRFDPEIETTAYRIVQESLTNVAKHAQATRVRLEIYTESDQSTQRTGRELTIEIEDNGVGFDPQTALAQNRGLSGMRERAQLVGGTFEIQSENGLGSRKYIRLPLQEE